MKTQIAASVETMPRRVAAAAIALTAIGFDFWLSWSGQGQYFGPRLAPALLGLILLLVVVRGRASELGLSHRVRGGYWHWVVLAFWIGVVLAALIGCICLYWYLTGQTIPLYSTEPTNVFGLFVYACVTAPLVEEVTYRIVLCAGLKPLCGAKASIVVSGAIFAALHYVYGNPSPDNFLAGYFLTWAFFASDSIVIPLAMHSLGNAVAIGSQIGIWYLQNPS
ncbi:MAG: CPBP family intramembrane glutamic endopeptidase [Planctomycetota bacterium]